MMPSFDATNDGPTARERAQLVNLTSNLTPGDFKRLVASIDGANARVDVGGTVAEEASRLVAWGESSLGPGKAEFWSLLRSFLNNEMPDLRSLPASNSRHIRVTLLAAVLLLVLIIPFLICHFSPLNAAETLSPEAFRTNLRRLRESQFERSMDACVRQWDVFWDRLSPSLIAFKAVYDQHANSISDPPTFYTDHFLRSNAPARDLFLNTVRVSTDLAAQALHDSGAQDLAALEGKPSPWTNDLATWVREIQVRPITLRIMPTGNKLRQDTPKLLEGSPSAIDWLMFVGTFKSHNRQTTFPKALVYADARVRYGELRERLTSSSIANQIFDRVETEFRTNVEPEFQKSFKEYAKRYFNDTCRQLDNAILRRYTEWYISNKCFSFMHNFHQFNFVDNLVRDEVREILRQLDPDFDQKFSLELVYPTT